MKTARDSTAPGATTRRDARPPITPDSASSPGAVDRSRLRRTVWPRAIVSPRVWETPERGHAASSAYVRTFWTALLGPGAVADLLRLATAASRDRSLRRPLGLSRLCSAGLAREQEGQLEVRVTVPTLTKHQLRTLHPAVRRLHEHPQWSTALEESPAA
ncbi:MAG: hypothetical protein GY720_11500 [bacterium]|nr:hypothetical protein [bacterium]